MVEVFIGGLGITKLADVNTALLTKWTWRFKNDLDGMWRRVIESIHWGRGRWTFLSVNNSYSGCCEVIYGMANEFVV